jgi:hypothetical protein
MGCTVASGGRFQPGTQRRVVLTPDRAWAPKDGFALQRAGLALLHDRPFHGRHRDSKPARGFSHGLTLGHRAHQAFFEVGRIGTHTRFPRINRACFRFPQVALMPDTAQERLIHTATAARRHAWLAWIMHRA